MGGVFADFVLMSHTSYIKTTSFNLLLLTELLKSYLNMKMLVHGCQNIPDLRPANHSGSVYLFMQQNKLRGLALYAVTCIFVVKFSPF